MNKNALSSEREREEASYAEWYADALRDGQRHDWPLINLEISNRWSMSALNRIKTKAWKIAEARDRAATR